MYDNNSDSKHNGRHHVNNCVDLVRDEDDIEDNGDDDNDIDSNEHKNIGIDLDNKNHRDAIGAYGKISNKNNSNAYSKKEDDMQEQPLIEIDRNKILLPDWLYDIDLKNGDIDTISSSEIQFWIDLIEKYLKPLELTQRDKVHLIKPN